MLKQQIHFIINPISGTGENLVSEKIIRDYFPKEEGYHIHIFFTEYKFHAKELALASVNANADMIVASGGDGTINEVAGCVVGTEVTLGIIPAGSGNGLASNLNIPKNFTSALNIIKKGVVVKIDVGTVDGNYFFSNSGIGFDAQVIKNYEASNERTITSYLKSSMKALKELASENTYSVKIDDKIIECQPFMIFVSNSNELGYNLSLTPKASLMDGELDVLIVTKINKIKALLFAFLMIFNKHEHLKEVQIFKAKNIIAISKKIQHIEFQLDGEVKKSKSNTLHFSILKNSLKLIVPKV